MKTAKKISGYSALTVQLRHSKPDDERKSRLVIEGHVSSDDCCGWFPVKIEATIELKRDDLVWVELTKGAFLENNHNLTSFGGFLVHLTK